MYAPAEVFLTATINNSEELAVELSMVFGGRGPSLNVHLMNVTTTTQQKQQQVVTMICSPMSEGNSRTEYDMIDIVEEGLLHVRKAVGNVTCQYSGSTLCMYIHHTKIVLH